MGKIQLNKLRGLAMKNSLLLLIVFAAFIYPQKEEKVDSKVVSATVFKNRALITREAQLNLAKGRHKIIFSNLPLDLQNESVRISTPDPGIKILDVKVEQRFTTEVQQKDIKVLEAEIDSLNQLVIISSDEIAILNSKREFVEALKAQSSKYINEKMLMNLNSSKDWMQMLSFVENNLSEVYKGLRVVNRKKTLIEQKIAAIRSEIVQDKGTQTKNYKEVILILETENGGKAKILPSYLVQSASWYPLYDIRVLSQTKMAELHYFGMVQQSTGEDWENISVTLSTAEPMSVKTLPGLDRWFVDIKPLPIKHPDYSQLSNSGITYDQNWGLRAGIGAVTGYVLDKATGEPLPGANVILQGSAIGSVSDQNGKFLISNAPKGMRTLTFKYIGYEALNMNLNIVEKNTANLTVSLEPAEIHGEEVVVTAQATGQREAINQQLSTNIIRDDETIIYTNVYAKELSTSFEIPSGCSIPSDNSQHKVTIAIDHAPVEYSYTSVPKIIPAVYLKGKIVNKNEYPLLEGEINVFVDNDFINRTHLNTIVQSDTLALALGMDERIQIKKILINKFQESKGILGGSRQITYEYEIQVTNNRQTEESVLIMDQIPIAMNEEINVELIEPQKDEKEIGNDKKLEWSLNIKPGEKKIIPVKYKIEFPNNLNVYGLE